MRSPRSLLLWFIAGFIGVIGGHQVVLVLLNDAGIASFPAFQMHSVPPFGVPQLVSIAFWGGVWGIVLGLVAPWFGRGLKYWILVAIFGAVGPTLIAVAVVFPMKGIQPSGDPVFGLLTGLSVNAAWGLLTAFTRRLFR